jgi:hypothetical protein
MENKVKYFHFAKQNTNISCCCKDAKSRFQIILTTHTAHGAIHYPKIQMPKKN